MAQVGLGVVAREWFRIGVTGFGGPPAHIALLRRLVVDRMAWMDAPAFEDANAACQMLPGPASTQLAIFCAYRVAGVPGAIVGGLMFVVPAVVLVLVLALLFLGRSPPLWVQGAGAGASAAVAAVAVAAARGLLGPSLARARPFPGRRNRWAIYLVFGAAGAALVGPYLVLVLVGCGGVEMFVQTRQSRRRDRPHTGSDRPRTGRDRLGSVTALLPATIAPGGIGALVWTALKVGALSFGGGFVIVPLMQSDAVHTYHWMTNARFLEAVALGQVTPGPVVATIAAVGYAAHGIGGGLLAAAVAFLPSFAFILFGGGRFERLRANPAARAFLDGAGPAAIGAILGAAIVLAGALHEDWQLAVLAVAALALLGLRRGIVETLLWAGGVGVIAALLGAPLP